MKRLSLLYVFSLIAMLTACTEDYNVDVAAPQGWDQEETPDIIFQSAPSAAINLAAVSAETVQVCNFDVPVNSENASAIDYKIVLTAGDGAVKYTYDLTDQGFMQVDDLQKTIEQLYSKRPEQRDLTALVRAYISLGDESILAQSNAFTLQVTPVAPLIETGYYLIGDFCGWSGDTMPAFEHSGKDVYEDPYFSLTLTLENTNQYWKIIPQSNVDGGDVWADGVLGVVVDGSTAPTGSLTNENPQAGKIETPGTYKITLNMMDYTYEIKEVVPLYYMVGAIQGWSDSNMDFMLYPQSTSVFSYTGYFDGGRNFKFWMQLDFGNWANALGGLMDGQTDLSGALVADGGAICTPDEGLYTVTINVGNMTYEQTAVTLPVVSYDALSLIGEFNGWNGDDGSELDLTEYSAHNWILKNVTLPTGSLKIRANHDWSISWGSVGDSQDMGEQSYGKGTTDNGSNLYVPAGTYNIFFNDITGEYVFVILE